MRMTLTRCLAGLCFGVALAAPVKLAGAHGPTAVPATAGRLALDVELYESDQLVGQTLGANGSPAPGTKVCLVQDDRPLAEVVSGEGGYFLFKGVRPGVYTVALGESRTPVRAWAGELAPPTAAELAVVSTDPTVVRGQFFGAPSTMTMLAVGGVVAVATVATVVIVTNNDDDAS